MILLKFDTDRITDWETFHSVFAEVLGFPDFYGSNMDAWIDCMTSLDDPTAGMTSVHVPNGDVLVLHLEHVEGFAKRCPDQYADLVECAAFVNWRRVERGSLSPNAIPDYVIWGLHGVVIAAAVWCHSRKRRVPQEPVEWPARDGVWPPPPPRKAK